MDTISVEEVIIKHLDDGDEFGALILFSKQALALQARSEAVGAQYTDTAECIASSHIAKFVRLVESGDLDRARTYFNEHRLGLFASAGELMSAIYGAAVPDNWPRRSTKEDLLERSLLFGEVLEMMLPSEYFSMADEL